jgi:hypothetical protein
MILWSNTWQPQGAAGVLEHEVEFNFVELEVQ